MPNTKRFWVLSGLVAVWAVTAVAQQKVMSPQDQGRFTGYSEDLEETGLVTNRRHFDAASYTAWHSHDKGQLLFVESGRMRIQRRGEGAREIGPNQTDYTGPGVIHWHGALPGQPLQQVGVTFGGETRWMEKVAPQQYGAR
jgi:quercetin dioxygenase-like cupin family protein